MFVLWRQFDDSQRTCKISVVFLSSITRKDLITCAVSTHQTNPFSPCNAAVCGLAPAHSVTRPPLQDALQLTYASFVRAQSPKQRQAGRKQTQRPRTQSTGQHPVFPPRQDDPRGHPGLTLTTTTAPAVPTILAAGDG